ncbi:hypothetical protein M885DRAFT_551003 [Pelagophyceae sp. CCMP2097]|nr:hypothetical protein M885DRAFT_551003 [Pelagophyceae sp. CCMP2097]|mmetsp:Transcript_169/g.636  ORF Transcript_169/g.636 Transcript_169/m.636 type:complete len:245 (+) Transcript_169:33-767(+)
MHISSMVAHLGLLVCLFVEGVSLSARRAPRRTLVQRRLSKAGTEAYSEIDRASTLLRAAAATKSESSENVVAALLSMEKAARVRSREAPAASARVLEQLDGAWRLVFTTGTVDTQKATGRVNYFPVKAVQTFDTSGMRISNGVFVGEFAVLRFYGPFEFDAKSRKLTFDFDKLALFNGAVNFDLGSKGAADIGAATGLGSKNNAKLVDKGKKPFFNWIDADAEIATARGGGGGLALWTRIEPPI